MVTYGTQIVDEKQGARKQRAPPGVFPGGRCVLKSWTKFRVNFIYSFNARV